MEKTNLNISRVPRSKIKAKSVYNKMSKFYDFISGSSERKFKEIGLRNIDINEGENVLEIGYGTGHCILALAQSVGTSGQVYGVDISEGMHNITHTRIWKAGLLNRVKLFVGDALKHPFEKNFFNAIFMSFTLELFDTPEILPLLDYCRSILQPNGRICVISLVKKERETLMVKLYELIHRWIPSYVDCRPIFLQKVLKMAKFYVINVEEMSMWGLPVEIVLAKK